MDWVLAITTLGVNFGIGWLKGVWWMWMIHALNAVLWIWYSIVVLDQPGLAFMSAITAAVDVWAGGTRRYQEWVKSTQASTKK